MEPEVVGGEEPQVVEGVEPEVVKGVEPEVVDGMEPGGLEGVEPEVVEGLEEMDDDDDESTGTPSCSSVSGPGLAAQFTTLFAPEPVQMKVPWSEVETEPAAATGVSQGFTEVI